MTPVRALLTVAVVALLAGCGGDQTVTAGPRTEPTPSSAPCPPPDAEGTAQIDWVSFVKVDGRMYSALQPNPVPESSLGELVATVSCEIGAVVGNPDFRARDGDAAYLPAGTELRSFANADPELRLAVQEDGGWRVYEVSEVPGARTGADVLDLAAGVEEVSLLDGNTATEVLGAVSEPAEVMRLVDAVLAAPATAADYERLGDEAPVFVRFTLTDGTFIQRAWHRSAGVLASQVAAPDELRLLLD